MEKVYFRSQILVHKYWTILDHFGIPVLFASGYNKHVFKNANITFSGNTGTPEMFQYSTILGRSSIWDLKFIFSKALNVTIIILRHVTATKSNLDIDRFVGDAVLCSNFFGFLLF